MAEKSKSDINLERKVTKPRFMELLLQKKKKKEEGNKQRYPEACFVILANGKY